MDNAGDSNVEAPNLPDTITLYLDSPSLQNDVFEFVKAASYYPLLAGIAKLTQSEHDRALQILSKDAGSCAAWQEIVCPKISREDAPGFIADVLAAMFLAHVKSGMTDDVLERHATEREALQKSIDSLERYFQQDFPVVRLRNNQALADANNKLILTLRSSLKFARDAITDPEFHTGWMAALPPSRKRGDARMNFAMLIAQLLWGDIKDKLALKKVVVSIANALFPRATPLSVEALRKPFDKNIDWLSAFCWQDIQGSA